jgi:acyl-CoA synthetase (AMP-forming)/AMP-acid ligase II/acyl carrier protein
MRFPAVNDCQSIPELVRLRAALHPTRVAAIYVDDDGSTSQLLYQDLWQKSLNVAASLATLTPASVPHAPLDAPRVMLIHPPGLDFLTSFIGAQIAGWIPVPTSYPKPYRAMPRVDAVAQNCSPSAILSTRQTIDAIDRRKLDVAAASLPMIACDEAPELIGDNDWQGQLPESSIALLQYTSGSTSEPKGVIVSQANVIANLKAIAQAFHVDVDLSDKNECTSAVSWLPFFHDMGLIGGVLAPIYCGYRSIFMSPQSFIQRPIRWFQLISQYKAVISGGPNFAYELCADRIAPSQAESLDLSSWNVAFCGAEPIRARTLHTFAQRFSPLGFRDSAFLPCYGLAEATLIAAGSDGPQTPKVMEVSREALRDLRVETVTETKPRRSKQVAGQKSDTVSLVACGIAALGTQVKIVDPDSCMELEEKQIGEIWLQGESITSGYWNRADENVSRFGNIKPAPSVKSATRWFRKAAPQEAQLPASGINTLRPSYLRTGDLGYLHDGQLYVTGRIKDIVIVRGRNYAPQDIELSVSSLGESIQGKAVAISIDGPRAESLALIVEIARDTPAGRHLSIVRNIRRAIISDHEVDPRVVLLVRPGTIPVTTSGKVQRSECRRRMLDGTLESRYRWERSGGTESPPLPIPELPTVASSQDRDLIESHVRDWLKAWLIARVGIAPDEIQLSKQFDEYGLDSLTAVELSGELEDWSGVELTPTNAWEHPSIQSMASLVTDGLISMLHDPSLPLQAEPDLQVHSWPTTAK